MSKAKVLPGQIEIPRPFKLTVSEKRLIRAYVIYKRVTCYTPKVSEILEMFEWSDEQHERYVPAYRDWSLDDQRFWGEFERVRGAIEGYIKECQDKYDLKI